MAGVSAPPALCGCSSRRRLEQSSALREAALFLAYVVLASVSFGKLLAQGARALSVQQLRAWAAPLIELVADDA